tara:strand:- start:5440 stop:6345 length:906 start_codon:yes stop_codon:yes gene_type:complete
MPIPLITHPAYSYDFPGKHRFPMQKFALLHEYLQSIGLATKTNTLRPGRAKHEFLQTAHCADYISRFCEGHLSDKEVRRLGLPWSKGLVRRTVISPAGTLLAAHYALNNGIACHLAGGTHHAHYDFASGFCIFNDLAITAKTLLSAGLVNKVLIFDLDVHQGDGTARILEHTPEVFTCSIHCAKNFPARKATSDLDVNLAVGMADDDYLKIVTDTLAQLIEQQQPDLILYDAGVDVYADDPLGLLNISLEGIRLRDHSVLKQARDAGVPIMTVIGGGYDKDQKALARRHAIAVEEAYTVFG